MHSTIASCRWCPDEAHYRQFESSVKPAHFGLITHLLTRMSTILPEGILRVESWLHRNAFWNHDRLEIGKSAPHHGTGVFLRTSSDQDDDRLLLRIPKANILSPKNSCIFNLLTDYVSEEGDRTVDLSLDVHALLLSCIYEESMGLRSPWFDYLSSIHFEGCSLPLCLWDDADKKLLRNTECDLLHMLDEQELQELYEECIRFAVANAALIPIPEVFLQPNLQMFGKFLQVVMSRSFAIDSYHGLGMVPGADIFNHSDQPDVEFIKGDEVCEKCGEDECEHADESDNEAFSDVDVSTSGSDDEGEREGIDKDIGDLTNENSVSGVEGFMVDEMALESELVDSEDETFEHNLLELELEVSGSSSHTEELEDFEITPAYIEAIERELAQLDASEGESERDIGVSDDDSELNLSDDEPLKEAHDEDLAKLLATDQCCDVILHSEKAAGEELFNFYGTLSSPYLLQQYGFVQKNNDFDTLMLTVQMFAHIKSIHGRQRAQLETKLQWYEELGFELINDLVRIGVDTKASAECQKDCCEDGPQDCCGEEGEANEDDDAPVSWELSPKVCYDGSPSPQTYALIRLMLMPFNLFEAKILHCLSEGKLCRRLLSFILPNASPIKHPRLQREHEHVFKIFNQWCQSRLARYKDGLKGEDYNELLQKSDLSPRRKMILQILLLEKRILALGCTYSADDHAAKFGEESD